MCGFAGIINQKKSHHSMHVVINNMTNSISHRGPDDKGIWVDQNENIALGHRRLSVIDVTNAGSQPMHSHDNNLVIVFNGEIYNHLEIRKILESELSKKIKWRGQSDTETILCAIDFFGIERALEISVGMFAFALWDKTKKSLTLARDRVGEKPLYYGWIKDNFVFGSELKAIKRHPLFKNNIDKNALQQFLRFSYIPTPMSIYENIFKLEPGHYAIFNQSDINLKKFNPCSYWSLSNTILSARENLVTSKEEGLNIIENTLEQSIKLQMISDVPLGAFLSGGIDSSVIVSLMQQHSLKKIKTFTIGFEENNFDEAPFAKKVAEHLGTDHEELIVTAKQAQDIIPRLPTIYDEPFADSSQIPTYFVSMAARKKVTVALSGDAGDEVFGGYNRYIWGPKIWNKASLLPFQLRALLGKNIKSISTKNWDRVSKITNLILPGNMGIVRLGDKAHKLGTSLESSNSMTNFYHSLLVEWDDMSDLIKFNDETLPIISLNDVSAESIGIAEFASSMMYEDTLSYLPDDILCKVDRAAMSNSLETRAPFLDHRLIEAAWRLPQKFKVNELTSKLPLRHILSKYIPSHLIDRPKAGFGIPLGEWLRGPLKSWAEELINPSRIESEGFFYSEAISSIWETHLSGHADLTEKLWRVLMFQCWLENEQNNLSSNK